MSPITFRFWRQDRPTSAFLGKVFFTPDGMKKDCAGSVLLGQYGINVNFSERMLEAVKVKISGKEVQALVPKMVDGKAVYSESQVTEETSLLANIAVQAFWDIPNISSATMQIAEDGQPEVIGTTIAHEHTNRVPLAVRGAKEAIELARQKAGTPEQASIPQSQDDNAMSAAKEELSADNPY